MHLPKVEEDSPYVSWERLTAGRACMQFCLLVRCLLREQEMSMPAADFGCAYELLFFTAFARWPWLQDTDCLKVHVGPSAALPLPYMSMPLRLALQYLEAWLAACSCSLVTDNTSELTSRLRMLLQAVQDPRVVAGLHSAAPFDQCSAGPHLACVPCGAHLLVCQMVPTYSTDR